MSLEHVSAFLVTAAVLTVLAAGCSGKTDPTAAAPIPLGSPAPSYVSATPPASLDAGGSIAQPILTTGAGTAAGAASDSVFVTPPPVVASTGATSGSSVVTAPPASTAATVPTSTATLLDLTAIETASSHDVLLLQKFSSTVTVTNGSSVTRTGTVTVTFVHGTTAESGSPPQSQTVSVPAGGTTDLTFTDATFHPLAEDVTIQVTTDAYKGP